MICVGIDVAKNKHDCFILSSDGEAAPQAFQIANDREGFDGLYEKICSVTDDPPGIKIGLEATGHYSRNLHAYLLEKGLSTYLLNPLQTSLFRKGQSLRKTKTDKVDARSIAKLLLSEDLKPYQPPSYHNQELKALTRYRQTKVQERSKLKVAYARLVNILFPELEQLSVISDLHLASIYAMFEEFPGASFIAKEHLTRLTNLLFDNSKGWYGKDIAILIRDAARSSIDTISDMISMELQQTIRLIREYNTIIDEIDKNIEQIVQEIDPPLLTIRGIGPRMGAIILAELGDITRFKGPDQVLAYAGLSPTTYQSGQLKSPHAKMDKRGSTYLRYALIQATKYVCLFEPVFANYLAKKRQEGKHYNVAISHAAKKLVRVIYKLQTSGQAYSPKG